MRRAVLLVFEAQRRLALVSAVVPQRDIFYMTGLRFGKQATDRLELHLHPTLKNLDPTLKNLDHPDHGQCHFLSQLTLRTPFPFLLQ